MRFFKTQYSNIKKDNPERWRRITEFHRKNGRLRSSDPAAFERELRRSGTRENRMLELLRQTELLQGQIEAGRVQGKAAEAQVDRLIGEFEELR